jgi:hypothetical protein
LEFIMGAWNKLFSDASKVKSTVSVKGADGVTRSARLNVGAVGLTDAAFAEAAKHGASLTETAKEVMPNGDTKTKRNAVKAADITARVASDCVADLLGYAPVPEPVRKRGQSVEPSLNATATNGTAQS